MDESSLILSLWQTVVKMVPAKSVSQHVSSYYPIVLSVSYSEISRDLVSVCEKEGLQKY